MKLTAVVQTNFARTISETEKRKAPTLAYPLIYGGLKKERGGEEESKPTKGTLSEEKEEIKPKIS